MNLRTTHLPDLLARLRLGDRDAANTLMSRCRERLEVIARAMLRHFPNVAAHDQTADVVQEASLSLLAALQVLDVTDTRSFYGLATAHIRRRFLDLARKYRPREAHAAASNLDADLERWTALHEAAERLPTEPREVFALRFYHGWTFAEIAPLLRMSLATVRRRWLEAMAALEQEVKEVPG